VAISADALAQLIGQRTVPQPAYKMLDRIGQQTTPSKAESIIAQRYQKGGVATDENDNPSWQPARGGRTGLEATAPENAYQGGGVAAYNGSQLGQYLPYQRAMAALYPTRRYQEGGVARNLMSDLGYQPDEIPMQPENPMNQATMAYDPYSDEYRFRRDIYPRREPMPIRYPERKAPEKQLKGDYPVSLYAQEGGVVDPKTGKVERNYATEKAGAYNYVDPRAKGIPAPALMGQGAAAYDPMAESRHGLSAGDLAFFAQHPDFGPVHTPDGVFHVTANGQMVPHIPEQSISPEDMALLSSMVSAPSTGAMFRGAGAGSDYAEPTPIPGMVPKKETDSGMGFQGGGVMRPMAFQGGQRGRGGGDDGMGLDEFGANNMRETPLWFEQVRDILNPPNPNQFPPDMPPIGPDTNLNPGRSRGTPPKTEEHTGGVIKRYQDGGVINPAMLQAMMSGQREQQSSPVAGEPSQKKQAPQPSQGSSGKYEFGPDIFYTAPGMRRLMEEQAQQAAAATQQKGMKGGGVAKMPKEFMRYLANGGIAKDFTPRDHLMFALGGVYALSPKQAEKTLHRHDSRIR
jgi:hypothetical protein